MPDATELELLRKRNIAHLKNGEGSKLKTRNTKEKKPLSHTKYGYWILLFQVSLQVGLVPWPAVIQTALELIWSCVHRFLTLAAISWKGRRCYDEVNYKSISQILNCKKCISSIVRRTLCGLYCPYFLPEVMVKFTRRVREQFVTPTLK